VAAELGLHEHTVGKWRRRFLKDRCEGLVDEARPGRPRTIDDDQVAAVIERTLRTTPVDATHWSIRSMAAETGFSHTTIRRMWAAFGLQPHRSQTFKLSSDPLFVDKVRDIVGFTFRRPTEPSSLASMRRDPMGVGGDRRSSRVRLLPDSLWRRPMQIVTDRPQAPTAIRTDLGAIFVSLELSRSTWLVTSLSPGGGEKMSKHTVRSGDVGGLRTRFSQLPGERTEIWLGSKSRRREWSRPPEPSPDASGILVRPLRAATGCEFEAASETGRVIANGLRPWIPINEGKFYDVIRFEHLDPQIPM
jgi:transposase